MDFKDGADDTKEYFYNGVGALVSDANKGIAHISYDNFNHPREIQFTNGGVIKDMSMHQTAQTENHISNCNRKHCGSNQHDFASPTCTDIIRNSVEYLGDEVYENGALSKYLFTDGYASLETNTPVFHYFTKDHLGNIRTVVNGQRLIGTSDTLLPFRSYLCRCRYQPSTPTIQVQWKRIG